MPAALKRELCGQFALRSSDGERMGKLVTKEGCGWGLGSALRRSGAREGDYLLLLIDLSGREAEFRLGSESLLHEAASLAKRFESTAKSA